MGMRVVLYAVTADQAERIVSDSDSMRELMRPSNDEGILPLEKAWHGIHFLLTGDPEGGDFPLAFLSGEGGESVEGLDRGYGPGTLFRPDEIRQIHSALKSLSEEEFWSRFDAEQMNEADIYPDIWDEPEADLRDEYVMYFRELKEFIRRACEANKLILVTMR